MNKLVLLIPKTTPIHQTKAQMVVILELSQVINSGLYHLIMNKALQCLKEIQEQESMNNTKLSTLGEVRIQNIAP